MFINYAHIAAWGVSNTIFVVVIQKSQFDPEKKYYFETDSVFNQTKLDKNNPSSSRVLH